MTELMKSWKDQINNRNLFCALRHHLNIHSDKFWELSKLDEDNFKFRLILIKFKDTKF